MGNCLTICATFSKYKKENIEPEKNENLEVEVININVSKKNIYILGSKNVGKNTFIESYKKEINNNVDVNLCNDGKVLISEINLSYDILLIIYDICSIESFRDADKLIKNNINITDSKHIYLMANKYDRINDAYISIDNGIELANKYSINFKSISLLNFDMKNFINQL